jgi:beta-glucanase (GH16 family)
VADLELIWRDEFDGPAGTPPDPSRWGYELGDGTEAGNPGWGNDELQVYTDDAANAALDGNGNLAITARRDATGGYTSARLLTRDTFAFAYGRIESRVRVPRGAGLWPAVWMLGANIPDVGWPDCGEIDVMEHVAREPRRIYGTIHGPGYCGDNGYGRTSDLEHDLADDFHVFRVDWSPGALEWFCDDVRYHWARPEDVAPSTWAFDHPFFVLVNLAVGGHFGQAVAESTVFPQALLVDYVRIYQAE